MDSTLAARQVSRAGLSDNILRDRAISIAKKIVDDVPDIGQRRVFATTGLTTRSCLYLDDYISNNSSHITRIIQGQEGAVEAAGVISEIAAGLSESEVGEAFSGSYLDLLRLWMGGNSIPDIRNTLGEDAPSMEQLARFIENYFGGRLPWVTSGFLYIATARLGLDGNLVPLAVRTLPAMIKVGVEFPEAAWAAAAGAASRDAAIRIGMDYVSARAVDTGVEDRAHTYSRFLDWLRPLTSEELNRSYGLEGAVLEETLRSFQRNATNPLLGTEIKFPMEFNVRGIAYENRRQIAVSAGAGSEVFLRRDYDNLVDRNAILVVFQNQPLGYMPRDYAQLIAPEVDAGWLGKCSVVYNEPGLVPSVRVRMEE